MAAPDTITFLSGDVHNSYLAEVNDPARLGARSRIVQAVCSPIRNPMPRPSGSSCRSSRGRSCGRCGSWPRGHAACRPAYPWTVTDGPWFDNNIALVTVGPEALETMWVTGVVEADPDHPRLEQVHAARIAPLPAAVGGDTGLFRVDPSPEHRGGGLALGGQEAVPGRPCLALPP